MQTPGKATRRRSPCCTVNPLRNTLLPLQCPPTHRARMAAPLPAHFCPGQLAVLFATTQCLPSSPNLQCPCFVAPEIKKAITASNKGSTLQQWGLPVTWRALLPLQPSLYSPVSSWFSQTGSLGLGLSLRGKTNIQQWDREGYRQRPGAAPCRGPACSRCPPRKAGRGRNIRALPSLVSTTFDTH